MSQPSKGDRRFRIWLGGLSGTVWAGSMRYDGERWVSTGTRHDVTEDAAALLASREAIDALSQVLDRLRAEE